MFDFNVKLFVLLAFSMVFDWTYQTDWEATNKTKSINARLSHAAEYTILTTLLIFSFYKSLKLLPYHLFIIYAILLISHFWIDSRKFVKWWMIHIKQMPEKYVNLTPNSIKNIDLGILNAPILQIGVDQCFHIIVSFIIAVIVVYI